MDENLGSARNGSPSGVTLLLDPGASVLQEAFLFPFAVVFPLCKDWEDSSSPAAVVGSGSLLVVRQLSPVSIPDSPESTLHAKSARNPSPAMDLIRRGFFGPRAVSPPPSLSSQGGKVSPGKADENPASANGSLLPVVKGNYSHPYGAA